MTRSDSPKAVFSMSQVAVTSAAPLLAPDKLATSKPGNIVKIGKSNAKSATAPRLILEVDRVHNIPPALISIEEGYNVRSFNPANPDDKLFAHQIAYAGVTTPLTVRQDAEGNIFLVAGHRRLGAVKWLNERNPKAPIATVPVMLSTVAGIDKRERRDIDLFVSNSGKPLTTLEKSAIAIRLHSQGYKDEDIAKAGGFTPRYAKILIGMGDWPTQLQEWLGAEIVTATLLTDLVRDLDKGNPAATNTIKAVSAAIDKVSRSKGFGQPVKITAKNIDMPKAPAAAPVVTKEGEKPVAVATVATVATTPATTRAPQQPVAKPDSAPVAPAVVETAKPDSVSSGTKRLVATGPRITCDGNVIATFTGNTAELAASRAKHYLPAFEALFATAPK